MNTMLNHQRENNHNLSKTAPPRVFKHLNSMDPWADSIVVATKTINRSEITPKHVEIFQRRLGNRFITDLARNETKSHKNNHVNKSNISSTAINSISKNQPGNNQIINSGVNPLLQRKCKCHKEDDSPNICKECQQKLLQRLSFAPPPGLRQNIVTKTIQRNDRHVPVSNSLLQRACVNEEWQQEYDGCSIPTAAAWAIGTSSSNNPARGRDTWFSRRNRTGPCDQHDRCYQTCHNGSSKAQAVCDRKMYEDMMEVCRSSKSSPQIRSRCFHYAGVYYMGLRAFGESAFNERQQQVCNCASPGNFKDDDMVRNWVYNHRSTALSTQTPATKIKMITTLLEDWISDEDVATIDIICRSVTTSSEAASIRQIIRPRLLEMTSIGQRTRVRISLSQMP